MHGGQCSTCSANTTLKWPRLSPVPTKDPILFVAPARLAFAKIETTAKLSGQFDAPFKLKDALAPIQKDYDYIVVGYSRRWHLDGERRAGALGFG